VGGSKPQIRGADKNRIVNGSLEQNKEVFMKDEFKRQRKILRPNYSAEVNGKGIKKINRRIVRARLKRKLEEE
jgi:hypothetical protein